MSTDTGEPVPVNAPPNSASRDAVVAVAKQKAGEHELFPELVCAICEQESGWDPWAIRYEPEFLRRYIHPPVPTAPSTEELTEAMSWGLMQVMGKVAREHGFKGRFFSELCDPHLGLDVGCKVLFSKLAAAKGDVSRALQLWNGGANSDYAAQVLARANKYKA